MKKLNKYIAELDAFSIQCVRSCTQSTLKFTIMFKDQLDSVPGIVGLLVKFKIASFKGSRVIHRNHRSPCYSKMTLKFMMFTHEARDVFHISW